MIKKTVFCLATICVVTLTGCDCSPDVSENIGSHEDNLGNNTYESAETTRDVIHLQVNEDIIANPNNIVDNFSLTMFHIIDLQKNISVVIISYVFD